MSVTPIDLLSETVLTMGQAAKLFPSTRGAKCIHVTTITRWIMKGKKFEGRFIKLEGAFLPGGLRTTREAINRFMQRLQELRDPDRDPVNQIQSPTQKQRFNAEVMKKGLEDQQWIRDNLKALGK